MAAAYEPPTSDDRGPLVIRPSWRSLRLRALGFGPILLALLVWATVRASLQDHVGIGATLATCAVFVACYALYLTAYMMGTTIVVTADTIVFRRWFRSTASVPIRGIARIVRCAVAGLAGRGNARPTVFALSSSGRCVLSFHVDRWDPADLDRIWQQIGVTLEGSWDDFVWDSDLDKKFPGAF